MYLTIRILYIICFTFDDVVFVQSSVEVEEIEMRTVGPMQEKSRRTSIQRFQ